MSEDLRWLHDAEERHRRERALEQAVAEASTAVHFEIAPVLPTWALDLLPEAVIDAVDYLRLNADGPSSCPICLEHFRVGNRRTTLPCMHLFHSECMKRWLTGGSDKCPVCNASVSIGLGVRVDGIAPSHPSMPSSAPSTSISGEPSQDELRERRLALHRSM